MPPKFNPQQRANFVGKLGPGKALGIKAILPHLFSGNIPVMGQPLPAGSMLNKPLGQVGYDYCAHYQWFTENTDQDVDMFPKLSGGQLLLVVIIYDMDSRQVVSSEEYPVMNYEPGKDIGTTMHSAMLSVLKALNMEVATMKGLL